MGGVCESAYVNYVFILYTSRYGDNICTYILPGCDVVYYVYTYMYREQGWAGEKGATARTSRIATVTRDMTIPGIRKTLGGRRTYEKWIWRRQRAAVAAAADAAGNRGKTTRASIKLLNPSNPIFLYELLSLCHRNDHFSSREQWADNSISLIVRLWDKK